MYSCVGGVYSEFSFISSFELEIRKPTFTLHGTVFVYKLKEQTSCQKVKVWEETDQENIFGENKECDMAISYQAPGVLPASSQWVFWNRQQITKTSETKARQLVYQSALFNVSLDFFVECVMKKVYLTRSLFGSHTNCFMAVSSNLQWHLFQIFQ